MVVGPVYVVMVGLKASAVSGAEQGKGCTERPRQQLFGCVHWWGGGRGLCWVAETGRSLQ